jgi:tetratricopeptide (TPR) repeat protein
MVFRVSESDPAGCVGKSKVALDFAFAALRSGDVAGAEMRLRDRLFEDPSDADALAALAQIAAEQRRIEEATVLMRRAVAADPTPDRRVDLIHHLQRFAAPALALKELEELPAALRNRFDVKGLEAGILGILGKHERQIRIYREMAREQPEQPALWISLGNALKTVGKTEEAVKALQRAIRAQPSFGEAWWTLANFKSFRFSPRDIQLMRETLRRPLSDNDALHLHFAMGKALEDRGEYEQSFEHYAAGNALRARQFRPEQMAETELVDRSIATFTADFFERNRNAGCADPGPIFVVGLHRSGSTLIEQILASHPDIEGTTELVVMNNIRERLARAAGTDSVEAIARLKPEDFTDIGAEYLERTRAFRHTDRPFFVDKMPGNWLNLPLIRIALPKAKIIDARRHPMACGFSNFKQNYAVGTGFSYSLRTIGTFYSDYVRFMRHFDAVQPGAAHRVLNETLIEDPEGEVRRLFDYLGLPFDPATLEFHKNERAIQTPSAEQVRRPINREGVDYWRHYEPWLGDLKESLGTTLEDWQG